MVADPRGPDDVRERPRKWLGWVVQAHERLEDVTKLVALLCK